MLVPSHRIEWSTAIDLIDSVGVVHRLVPRESSRGHYSQDRRTQNKTKQKHSLRESEINRKIKQGELKKLNTHRLCVKVIQKTAYRTKSTPGSFGQ